MKRLGYIALIWMFLSNIANAEPYTYGNPSLFGQNPPQNNYYQQQLQNQINQQQQQMQQMQQQQYQQQPRNQMPFNATQSIQPYVQGQHRGWGY